MAMRLPGVRRTREALRQARSRLGGGIAVLGYHRIGNGADPFGLAVSPDHFAAHMDVLGARARPLRLAEAVRAAAQPVLPPRAVAVTLDDGYADTLERALPVLERSGVPATVFLVTGCPGEEFWWDELSRILLTAGRLPPRLDLQMPGWQQSWTIAEGPAGLDRRGVAARRRTLGSVADAMRVLPPPARRAAMQQVRQWASETPGAPGRSPERPRALTRDEIRQLASSPGIEIGAHTVSHPVLPSLPPDVQRAEISQSRDALQRLTGSGIASFSYPHGAYTDATRAMVAQAGFSVACCSRADVLTSRSSPLEVPRLWVPDLDGRGFAAWLRRWLSV
jgi:peptidoglycan/xylan/chitin deacetylase (PgdA/CDA1 family)